jgi:hypothetical protein
MKKLNNYLFIIFSLIIFIKLFIIQKKRKLNKIYEKYENNQNNVSNLGDNLEGINTTLQGISKKIDFLTGYKQIIGGANELNISEDDNNKDNYYDKDTKFVKEEDDDEEEEDDEKKDEDDNEDYNEPSNESENTNNNTNNNTNSVVEEIKYKRERVNLNQPLKSNLDCINLKNSAKYGINKLTTEQSEKLKECNLN